MHIAVIVPVRRDKRSLFVVPSGPLDDGAFRHVYVGTTDSDYRTARWTTRRRPVTTSTTSLKALNESLDTATNGVITRAAITGVWAGLRPLVKSAQDAESGSTKDLRVATRSGSATRA